MKRDFSPQEWEAASLLARALGGVDQLVFPENPIKILIIKQRSGNIGEKVGYVSSEDSTDGEERYNIYAYGIDRYLEAIIKRSQKVVVMFDDQGRMVELEDLPLLTLKVLVIGTAAHEVRHRLQGYRRIRMFGPADADNETLSPRTRAHIGLRKRFPASEQRDPAREFDAKVIELLAEEICYEEGDLKENMANLLLNKD